MSMSWDEAKARKKYYLNFSYIRNPKRWVRSGDNIVCECGRGYGSPLDGLCQRCRFISVRDGYDMIMEYLSTLPAECLNKGVDLSLWTGNRSEAITSFKGEYAWLSNMQRIDPFLYGHLKFGSVECFYVAMKTTDVVERAKIAKMNPYEAKKYGRTLKLRDDWDDIKLGVMKWGLLKKFSQKKFKQLLLSTGDQELIEGNTWGDTFWGVCNGVGENHLGKLLMEIRESLRRPS